MKLILPNRKRLCKRSEQLSQDPGAGDIASSLSSQNFLSPEASVEATTAAAQAGGKTATPEAADPRMPAGPVSVKQKLANKPRVGGRSTLWTGLATASRKHQQSSTELDTNARTRWANKIRSPPYRPWTVASTLPASMSVGLPPAWAVESSPHRLWSGASALPAPTPHGPLASQQTESDHAHRSMTALRLTAHPLASQLATGISASKATSTSLDSPHVARHDTDTVAAAAISADAVYAQTDSIAGLVQHGNDTPKHQARNSLQTQQGQLGEREHSLIQQDQTEHSLTQQMDNNSWRHAR